MLLFECDGHAYKLVFQHHRKREAPGTTCRLFEAIPLLADEGLKEEQKQHTWAVVGIGATRRAPTDTLHRPLGRELSLLRLCQKLPRQLRGAVLGVYHKKIGRHGAKFPAWAKRLLEREHAKLLGEE